MPTPFDDLGPTREPDPPRLPRVARRPKEDEDEDDRQRESRPRGRYREPPRERPRTEGVLPRTMVRMVSFVILTLCLIISGTIIILSVWGAAGEWAAWRAVATLGVVAGMTAGFAVLNEVFGRKITEDAEDDRRR